ncbi:ABC-2 type transport system ATP-binding protein [Anaerosphaera aminiphila DSM 21120]|uniref:ABC-2 type transport system ATP-binding protein n=1 Tax=Anaerosphaera aminiphila DSM 21120 TaxID=1120995 RepID=A0A1M5P0J9_9FIRM|nr:ABC transporter ATP-binding protein [Anaerosphaera aminiphila]SHG95346.1 ABC-2 type transport system ATP-binding protein [Anaerosphaera aminiphila DSM 21120]
MSAIVISDLTKRIGKRSVFSNIDLEVIEGEFFALLGLEDSGKTTLARILFNYLKPAKGTVSIFDMDSSKDSKAIKESVSFVPEELLFQENAKVINLLKTTLNMHNLKNSEEIDMLLDYFNLNPKLRVLDMDNSEKKIFSIINALIVKPRLLIMDEPTKYLSDSQVEKLFTYLNDLKVENSLTLFMLTNSLSEAQRFCDRVAYLHEGEIRGVEQLNNKAANDKIIKIYSGIEDLTPFINIGAKIITSSEGNKILYYDKDMKNLSRVIYECEIDNYSIEDSSLSDKIEAYYSKKEEA